MLNQKQLSHIIMPIGDLSKEEVRALAVENELVVASKPDSQDICFIPDGDHMNFLEKYTGKKAKNGDFIDESGKKVGTHLGIWKYTIGQRKGLGLSMGKPVFVSDINVKNNTVTVSADESSIFKNTVLADDVSWMSGEIPAEPVKTLAKIRYAHKAAPATLYFDKDSVKVVFDAAAESRDKRTGSCVL